MRTRLFVPALFVPVLLVALTSVAQDEPVNGIRPADLRAHAIVGATVVTKPGVTLEEATILIRGGVIEAVGQVSQIPPDARVWSGEGLTVYPGLIDAAVLVEAAALPDAPGRHWNKMVRPERRMSEQPLLDASVRKTLRSLGFTTAAVYPSNGIFRGSGTVVALADDAKYMRVYDDRAALAVALDTAGSWGSPATPGSLMGSIAIVRQTLLDGGWDAASRAVYAAHPGGNEPPAPAEALVALGDALTGRQPVLFDVRDEHYLLRAARIADEFNLTATYLGAGNEFRRLDEVVALGAPLIIPVNFPKTPDVTTIGTADRTSLRELTTWEQAPTNPRRLVDAGADVALTTHRLKNRKDFPGAVRKAIQHGLTEDEALAALTTTPARLLGLDDRLGTIEIGKLANLVVVEGGLFEKKREVRDVWINGRRIEIDAAPDRTLAYTGMLVTDDGVALRVDLDTEKPSATFYDGEEKKTKAKKVAVLKGQVTMIVDGAPFDVEGYVQLGGAITGDIVTGTGMMPDGSRFSFSIAEAAEVHAAADEEKEAPDAEGDEDEDDGVSGTWSLTLESMRGGRSIPLTLEIALDAEGAATGEMTIMGREIEMTDATYEPATGRFEASFEGPRGDRTLTATIEDESITGAMGGPMGESTIEGTRGDTFVADADDDDDDFVMPAQDLTVPLGAYGRAAPAEPQDVLITNATIWTAGPAGVIENGTMLVVDGKIAAVGQILDIGVPDGVERIDAGGKHISPGLIDCHSHTGISGGANEFPQANTAEVRIGDVINPDDVNWYRQLAGGLTAANQLHGSANPIGGQNSVVKLRWGGSADDFRVDDALPGIKFALGENVKRSPNRYPNTRMGVETFIRDGFTAATEYRAEWDRYRSLSEADRARTMPPRRDLELDTLVEILEGRRIVHCHSYRQDEILMLVRVADDFGFQIGTFQHVLEGYKVADALAKHGAGASSFSDWWAYKVEVMDAIPYNGALMTDVGVVVSFNSDSSELARRMNTEASKAVRYGGLDPSEAIKLVTINPAKQLRIDHRTGSLEVGKDADFVIWSASPLSTYAICKQTWIEGRRYFDRATDQVWRETIQTERQRLVQKILAKSHGAPTSREPATEAAFAAPSGYFADLSPEAKQWLEDRIRAGEDPFEMHPGDCGCAGLWSFH